jgi:hypothetical protein
MTCASMGAEIKSPPGKRLYCFPIHDQIYHFVSPLYPNEASKPGYGELHIFYSNETTTRQFENQPDQGCMAEVMKRFD